MVRENRTRSLASGFCPLDFLSSDDLSPSAIGVAIRTSARGDTTTNDVRFSIISLRMGITQFTACVRGHWAIEHTLQWCLDMTFREEDAAFAIASWLTMSHG